MAFDCGQPRRRPGVTASLVCAFVLVGLSGLANGADSTAKVTYASDVAVIIQDRCQTCHRPGSSGPFSLVNYRQVKCWAPMIREVVETNRMPPWHADPHVGTFSNDRSLSAEEKATLLAWLDDGMPLGDPKALPEPAEWVEGWRIGEPDMIFKIPEVVTVEPAGVVPYLYFRTPTNFTEDKWVRAMEIRPDNPKALHHILVYIVDPKKADTAGFDRDFQGLGRGFLMGFAPGTDTPIFDDNTAVRIPAGSDLVWQLHYTPTGKTERDQSALGLIFADGPPERELFSGTAQNFQFEIPPHADRYPVKAETVFPRDGYLLSMTPHMHYRGKTFSYTAVYPDGKEEALLHVPHYDFNWQMTYDLSKPKFMPAGTKLVCTAEFDNSLENPYNPDPDKPVHWGDQTWEEMMIGWFQFSLANATPVAKAE